MPNHKLGKNVYLETIRSVVQCILPLQTCVIIYIDDDYDDEDEDDREGEGRGRRRRGEERRGEERRGNT
jgi:hypothetical protein